MNAQSRLYEPGAYTSVGELWWKSSTYPGSNRRIGDEVKLAAWLANSKDIEDTFSMPELRAALGDAAPNSAEHLNRRMRELRGRDGWIIYGQKDDGSLGMGEYRLQKVGWHPGTGVKRPPKNDISQTVRRKILDRDGSRCTVCGIGAGEDYPGEPGIRASMTIGHIIASAHGGSSKELNNLRAECKRCNEPVRQEMRRPETLEEVLPHIRNLKKSEKTQLLDWVHAKQRLRGALDIVYDRVRVLSPDEQTDLERKLRTMIDRAGL